MLYLLVVAMGAAVASAQTTDSPGTCNPPTADVLTKASATCGGITAWLDGPWVYKAGECRFCGGGDPVHWRVTRLRPHQTVAIRFGIQGTPKRFGEVRQIRLSVPGMMIRKGSSANPGTGNVGPRVAYDRDTYTLKLTPSFHEYSGRDMGGISDEVLAVVPTLTVSRVCPEVAIRFTNHDVAYSPGCWRVKSG